MNRKITLLAYFCLFWILLLNANANETELTIFYDNNEFIYATGSNVTVKFPNDSNSSQYKENNVIIKQIDSEAVVVDDFSDIITGKELTVSGRESIDIIFPESIKSFGIYIHDANVTAGGCSAHDSKFSITLKEDNTDIGTIESFDPPVDQLFFIGLVSTDLFNKVEIREIGATTSSTYCENDFFGPIYSTTLINELIDNDQDGVIDLMDNCLGTREGACTDKHGCECDYQYTEDDMLRMVNKLLDWDKNKDSKIGLHEAVQILKDSTGVNPSNNAD
ncbi:MAG: hypothetical protein OMM_10474 [Candidatus Magnetoglobus multicellularis str. Araruama]|uniref:EF-hand domain-containing protein n=1 Tax=Candidatus Magnetoglobus multicellularis str. Araruama TaxID=890399 RepID=A0A1V1P0Z3_9BACT|nr:MAG: hypothetical protein OMM_10474 [Candidatus Magnetoglobus multicellularis str. Araruama]